MSFPRSTALLMLPGLLAVLAGGCGKTEKVKAAPPARVENPVSEASLTSVHLTPDAVRRLGVQTAVVSRQRVQRSQSLSGEVTVRADASIVVTAPVSGTLSNAIRVPRAGDLVSSGQTLVRLVPLLPGDRDLRIEAEREVTGSEATVEVARKRARRAEQLLSDGSGSVRSVEEARADLERAEAGIAAARERMDLVRAGPVGPRGELDVRAPLSAHVKAVYAANGQTVSASAPLLDLEQLDPVWIRVPVYGGDVAKLDLSRDAEIVALGDTRSPPWVARRVAAPPSANAAGATVDLFFELPNRRASLRPGQRVGARLFETGGREAPVVPLGALVYDAQGGAWVYENTEPGTYVRRRVQVAHQHGTLVELDGGPDDGARVVVVGAAELFGTEFGAGK